MKTMEAKEEKKPNAVEGRTLVERFKMIIDPKTNRIISTFNKSRVRVYIEKGGFKG